MPLPAKADATHSLARAELHHPEPDGDDDRTALVDDPVVRHLRPCLQTARARPSEMCSGCLDHLETAVRAYLRQTHSVVPLSPPVTRGGLAPWQLRGAQEIMRSHLDEAVPLAELQGIYSGQRLGQLPRLRGFTWHGYWVGRALHRDVELAAVI